MRAGPRDALFDRTSLPSSRCRAPDVCTMYCSDALRGVKHRDRVQFLSNHGLVGSARQLFVFRTPLYSRCCFDSHQCICEFARGMRHVNAFTCKQAKINGQSVLLCGRAQSPQGFFQEKKEKWYSRTEPKCFAGFQQTLRKKIQLGDFIFLYEFPLPTCSIPCPSYAFSSFLLPAVRLSWRKPPVSQPFGLIFSLPSPFPPPRGRSGLVITGLGCWEPSPDWEFCSISAQRASDRGRPRNNVEFLQLSLNGCETLWDSLNLSGFHQGSWHQAHSSPFQWISSCNPNSSSSAPMSVPQSLLGTVC